MMSLVELARLFLNDCEEFYLIGKSEVINEGLFIESSDGDYTLFKRIGGYCECGYESFSWDETVMRPFSLDETEFIQEYIKDDRVLFYYDAKLQEYFSIYKEEEEDQDG